MMRRIRRRRPGNARLQRGFTIVAAVFLVTILSLLSAYLVGLRVYQESDVTLDTLGTRAYAAARSGAEWGAYHSLRNNTCAAATALALGGSLAGYTATVTCSRSTYDEGGTAVLIDTIVANACNQPLAGNCPNTMPAANYVERQMTFMVSP
jgi:MSHA biogenesis protein MshP